MKITSSDLQINNNELRVLIEGRVHLFLLNRMSDKFREAAKEELENYILDNLGENISWPKLNETWSIDKILNFRRLRFIAYFDYLGFANIIENNPIQELYTRAHQISRDIEFAFCAGEGDEPTGGFRRPNRYAIKYNCIRFSDTVIFYSNDFTEDQLNNFDDVVKEQLINIVDITDNYVKSSNTSYPTRGYLTIGEMEADYWFPNDEEWDKMNFTYIRNGIFGKGLVEASKKGEMQNWMGAYASKSIIELLQKNNLNNLITECLILYNLPFKDKQALGEDTYKIVENYSEEYCFRASKKIENTAKREERFNSYSRRTKNAFERQQELPISKDAIRKMENSIAFIKYCLEN
jgi:hypothetical protein